MIELHNKLKKEFISIFKKEIKNIKRILADENKYFIFLSDDISRPPAYIIDREMNITKNILS